MIGKLKAWLERVAVAAVPTSIWERLYRLAIRAANRRGNTFTTYHVRPKFARDVGTWSDPVVEQPRFAVVMQGPVVAAEDFTLETLRIYQKHMPGCRLILSTWNDADTKVLDPIRALGVDVVLSEKPANPGIMNVNLQLASTLAGMREAASGEAEWVLKTRTDQRMYATNLPEFLVSVAKAFPVRPGFAQRYRIVGLGRGTVKYDPYHITDQTVFGHMTDMMAYWSAPPRHEAHPPGYRDVFSDICRYHAPESYIVSNYLQHLGRAITWTIEDSWAAIADHFCIVDVATTDFFWPKYTRLLEYDRTYNAITTSLEIDFREWLILYCAVQNKSHLSQLSKVLELGLRMLVPQPSE